MDRVDEIARPSRRSAKCGSRSRYIDGCRCDECTRANREYQREADAARSARRLAGEMPEHIHGTRSGYGNWGCRCEVCVSADNAAQRQSRRSRAKVTA